MHWIWRALVAGLLLGGAMVWVPTMTTDAATPIGSNSSAARGPAEQDNDQGDNNQDDNSQDDNNQDNDDDDNVDDADNGNTNGNANDNDSAGDNGNTNGNANDNDAAPAPTATPVPGPPGSTTTSQGHGEIVNNGDLSVELFRSTSNPIVDTPFQIGVIGNGTPIDRIWWWADNPGGNGGDDFGHAGEVSHSCGGAQPCSGNWTIVGRNVGWYTIHARVRATDGREVQTDWTFLVQSNG